MTTLHRLLAGLFIAGLLGTGSSLAMAQSQVTGVLTVEVFANSAMHITPATDAAVPYKLTIYRLDGLQRIEQELSQRLPQNEQAARQWLQANEARLKREVTPEAVHTANGFAMASHFQINRLPAVLINRKLVVYGVTDVERAIALAGQSQGGQR